MSELTEMQNRLLKMLSFFHDFCAKSNICYYAIGGTALGAVRHNGFIPWDDDIDVGLPRPDYERFIRLFPKDNVKYIVESVYSSDASFCYSFSKIYDTSTTLVENTTTQLKRGIYIDVFPIDGIGNTSKEARKAFLRISRKKNLMTMRTIKINSARKWYKNALLWVVQHIPDRIAGEKKLCFEINRMCKKKKYEENKIVGNLVGAWGKKEIIPKRLLGTPTLHKFENIEVYIPERYDEYLSHIYGDWRKLPPKEKRVSHHGYKLDLNHSYLDSI